MYVYPATWCLVLSCYHWYVLSVLHHSADLAIFFVSWRKRHLKCPSPVYFMEQRLLLEPRVPACGETPATANFQKWCAKTVFPCSFVNWGMQGFCSLINYCIFMHFKKMNCLYVLFKTKKKCVECLIPFCSVLVRLHMEHNVPFWATL